MVNIFWAVVLVVLVLVVVIARRSMLEQVADASGRRWYVVARFDNKREAAQRLADIHDRVVKFMAYLKDKYRIDYTDEQRRAAPATNVDQTRAARYKHMLQNYNPDTVYENDPASGSTAYTVDKGAKTYLCIRSKADPRRFIDIDTVLFVVLHEIAHIANYSNWGHGPEFWRTFSEVLHEAAESGVYTPVDYAKTPVEYCGLLINYNPYWR